MLIVSNYNNKTGYSVTCLDIQSARIKWKTKINDNVRSLIKTEDNNVIILTTDRVIKLEFESGKQIWSIKL